MSSLWAAAAMLAQNVLAVFLVQAEARNRALLAGLLDCLMWPAGMITTTITVTALQGHHAGLKGEVIAAVTLANFVGSSAAVSLGRRFIRARRQQNGTVTSARSTTPTNEGSWTSSASTHEISSSSPSAFRSTAAATCTTATSLNTRTAT